VKNIVTITILLCQISFASAQSIDMALVKSDENFRWGVRAFHSGYYNDAILSFEKALSFKPEKILPRLWLGKTLYKSGFEEAALNEWHYILDSGRGDSLLRDTAAIVEFRRGVASELKADENFVIVQRIDANLDSYYPLRRPSSVRIREDGSVFIVAFATNEIVVVDINGDIREIWRGGIRGFDHPFDILEIDGQFIFVSEYGGNRIAKCNLSGDKMKVFGRAGTGAGELLGPQYLAADNRGYIYVTDWGNSRVNKYDFDGNYILSFGGKQTPGSLLKGPTGIVIQDNLVYVADRINKNIEVFDLSGNYLDRLGSGQLKGPEGLASKNSNSVIIADNDRIVEFDLSKEIWKTQGDLESYAGKLTSLAYSPNGELYVCDFDLNTVFILSDISTLYSSLFVQVENVDATNFPQIVVNLTVEDRRGSPIIGLRENNFSITEFHQPVAEAALIGSVNEESPMEVALVIEKNSGMEKYLSEIHSAAGEIHTIFERGVKIIGAGIKPRLEADFAASPLDFLQAATRGMTGDKWNFDLALHRAASELIPGHNRRAVIFLTEGSLPASSFQDFSLTEITSYLRNNSIALYTIYWGKDKLSRELDYISRETGGESCYFYSPEGIGPLLDEVIKQRVPLYTLSYRSRSPSDFGRKYIPLEASVNLLRRSGRAESGYFAPLE